MLVECLWLLVDHIRCQGQREALTQFILEGCLTSIDGKIFVETIWWSWDFDEEDHHFSPKQWAWKKCSKHQALILFENQMLDYTIIAHESFNYPPLSVYQTDDREVENALAFEVKNDETDKLILLLSWDIGVGEKLSRWHGTNACGKSLVYDKINENKSLAQLEIGILNSEYVIISISRRCFRLEKKLTP